MKCDVNQDFSKSTRQADQYGSTVIMKNNVPRHFSYKSSQIDAIQTASDEEVLAASKTIMQCNKSSFRFLSDFHYLIHPARLHQFHMAQFYLYTLNRFPLPFEKIANINPSVVVQK